MEEDYVCEYDSTWDTDRDSDGDDPAGESRTRRSSQDKNKSSWTLVIDLSLLLSKPQLGSTIQRCVTLSSLRLYKWHDWKASLC